MSSNLDRKLNEIEQEIRRSSDQPVWCSDCGHGQQLIILQGDEPEPICPTCGQPRARGEGIRLIRVDHSEVA